MNRDQDSDEIARMGGMTVVVLSLTLMQRFPQMISDLYQGRPLPASEQEAAQRTVHQTNGLLICGATSEILANCCVSLRLALMRSSVTDLTRIAYRSIECDLERDSESVGGVER